MARSPLLGHRVVRRRRPIASRLSSWPLELVEQRLPPPEPLDAEADRQREAVDPESGLVRVLANLPGVVPRAEEPRVLPGPDQRAFHQEGGEHDPAGDAVGPRADVVEPRGIARVIVSRGDLVEEGPRLGVPGQKLMGRVQVVRVSVRQRADDRPACRPAPRAPAGARRTGCRARSWRSAGTRPGCPRGHRASCPASRDG